MVRGPRSEVQNSRCQVHVLRWERGRGLHLRGAHGRTHGEAQEVYWGTWEVTNEEKEGRHMAGGRGEHCKTRWEAHEREPLFSNRLSALVIGDPFISATIPAFVRFFDPALVRGIARSPLCAPVDHSFEPPVEPYVVAQLLGNYPSKEP